MYIKRKDAKERNKRKKLVGRQGKEKVRGKQTIHPMFAQSSWELSLPPNTTVQAYVVTADG